MDRTTWHAVESRSSSQSTRFNLSSPKYSTPPQSIALRQRTISRGSTSPGAVSNESMIGIQPPSRSRDQRPRSGGRLGTVSGGRRPNQTANSLRDVAPLRGRGRQPLQANGPSIPQTPVRGQDPSTNGSSSMPMAPSRRGAVVSPPKRAQTPPPHKRSVSSGAGLGRSPKKEGSGEWGFLMTAKDFLFGNGRRSRSVPAGNGGSSGAVTAPNSASPKSEKKANVIQPRTNSAQPASISDIRLMSPPRRGASNPPPKLYNPENASPSPGKMPRETSFQHTVSNAEIRLMSPPRRGFSNPKPKLHSSNTSPSPGRSQPGSPGIAFQSRQREGKNSGFGGGGVEGLVSPSKRPPASPSPNRRMARRPANNRPSSALPTVPADRPATETIQKESTFSVDGVGVVESLVEPPPSDADEEASDVLGDLNFRNRIGVMASNEPLGSSALVDAPPPVPASTVALPSRRGNVMSPPRQGGRRTSSEQIPVPKLSLPFKLESSNRSESTKRQGQDSKVSMSTAQAPPPSLNPHSSSISENRPSLHTGGGGDEQFGSAISHENSISAQSPMPPSHALPLKETQRFASPQRFSSPNERSEAPSSRSGSTSKAQRRKQKSLAEMIEMVNQASVDELQGSLIQDLETNFNFSNYIKDKRRSTVSSINSRSSSRSGYSNRKSSLRSFEGRKSPSKKEKKIEITKEQADKIEANVISLVSTISHLKTEYAKLRSETQEERERLEEEMDKAKHITLQARQRLWQVETDYSLIAHHTSETADPEVQKAQERLAREILEQKRFGNGEFAVESRRQRGVGDGAPDKTHHSLQQILDENIQLRTELLELEDKMEENDKLAQERERRLEEDCKEELLGERLRLQTLHERQLEAALGKDLGKLHRDLAARMEKQREELVADRKRAVQKVEAEKMQMQQDYEMALARAKLAIEDSKKAVLAKAQENVEKMAEGLRDRKTALETKYREMMRQMSEQKEKAEMDALARVAVVEVEKSHLADELSDALEKLQNARVIPSRTLQEQKEAKLADREKALQKASDMVHQLQMKHQEEKRDLEAQLKTALEASQNVISPSRLNNLREEMLREKVQAMALAREETRAQLEEAELRGNQELAAIKNEHQAELGALRALVQKLEAERLEAQHDSRARFDASNEGKQMRANLEEKVRELQRQLQTAQAEYQAKIEFDRANLTEQYRIQMHKVEKELATKLKENPEAYAEHISKVEKEYQIQLREKDKHIEAREKALIRAQSMEVEASFVQESKSICQNIRLELEAVQRRTKTKSDKKPIQKVQNLCEDLEALIAAEQQKLGSSELRFNPTQRRGSNNFSNDFLVQRARMNMSGTKSPEKKIGLIRASSGLRTPGPLGRSNRPPPKPQSSLGPQTSLGPQISVASDRVPWNTPESPRLALRRQSYSKSTDSTIFVLRGSVGTETRVSVNYSQLTTPLLRKYTASDMKKDNDARDMDHSTRSSLTSPRHIQQRASIFEKTPNKKCMMEMMELNPDAAFDELSQNSLSLDSNPPVPIKDIQTPSGNKGRTPMPLPNLRDTMNRSVSNSIYSEVFEEWDGTTEGAGRLFATSPVLAHHLTKSSLSPRVALFSKTSDDAFSAFGDTGRPTIYDLMDCAPTALASIFGFAFSNLAGVSLSREWSRKFYTTVQPGCPFYSEVVRCRQGILSNAEKQALWDHLVLGNLSIDEKTKLLVYGNKDYDTLVKEGKEGIYASDIQKDVMRLIGWKAEEGRTRFDIRTESRPIMKDRMCNVLYASAAIFKEVGYAQGMSFPAFHLAHSLGLLGVSRKVTSEGAGGFHPDPTRVDAIGFHAFYAFLGPLGLGKIYASQLPTMNKSMLILSILIEQKLPALHSLFQKEGIEVELFAIAWFESLFVYIETMPVPTIDRIWDIYIADGSFKIFFQVALAILYLSKTKLLKMGFEGIVTYLQRLPNEDILHCDQLIPCALQINISDNHFANL